MCPKTSFFFFSLENCCFLGSSPVPKPITSVLSVIHSPQTHQKMRQGLGFPLKYEVDSVRIFFFCKKNQHFSQTSPGVISASFTSIEMIHGAKDIYFSWRIQKSTLGVDRVNRSTKKLPHVFFSEKIGKKKVLFYPCENTILVLTC